MAGRKGKKGEVPPTIQGDHNTYINIAADKLGLTPEAMNEAVAKAVTPKRQSGVARAAIDLFRPAKRGGNGRIAPAGLPEITKETVAAFPDEIALAELEDDTEIEKHDDVILEVRATDRDKAVQGWAGRLRSGAFETKRLSMRLYPDIDRETLAQTRTARVEALLESRVGLDGELKPLRIHVLRILD